MGPAETISGIIDTRPIGHRKPIGGGGEQQNNLYHMKNATSSPQMHVRNASLPANNVGTTTNVSSRSTETLPKPGLKPRIELPPEIIRPARSTTNEQRPNSTPHSGSDHFLYENMTVGGSTTTTTTLCNSTTMKNMTTNTTTGTTNNVQMPSSTTTMRNATSVGSVNTNHLTGKDCDSVPYENINLDYITRLMNEGYSKEDVMKALGEFLIKLENYKKKY